MQRRDFIGLVGSVAAWPAEAQQVPVVGFLSSRSPDEARGHTDAFRRGLEEMGFVDGRNVAVEYRWANGDYNRLPSFAADLLSRPLALMAATGDPAAQRRQRAFDFRAGYLMNDRMGIRILRDPSIAKPFVLFYTTKRVGDGVQDPNAIRVLKMA